MYKIIDNKNKILEISKIIGLILWFLFLTVSWLFSAKNTTPTHHVLFVRFLQAIAGYITISFYYYFLNQKRKQTILSNWLYIFLLVPINYINSFIWNLLSDIFEWIFKLDTLDLNIHNLLISAFFFIVPVFAFTALYYVVNHWVHFKKERENALIAAKLASDAQLQMLRYQINPHFLYNALNTIRSLVEEDTILARKMVTRLANFFRYSLSNKENTDLFKNEIKAINDYLDIQKIRFEDKLNIIYDIDEELYEVKLPFFIVLPLVENAIKYGLQSSKMPLTIKIYGRIGRLLEISVSNTGKLISSETNHLESTNTGISNIKKRLELCYANNYSFRIFEENNWVIAQIIIEDMKNRLTEITE